MVGVGIGFAAAGYLGTIIGTAVVCGDKGCDEGEFGLAFVPIAGSFAIIGVGQPNEAEIAALGVAGAVQVGGLIGTILGLALELPAAGTIQATVSPNPFGPGLQLRGAF